MLQNSMPMQPQLGIINPQLPVPFNNSNVIMPNMPPLMTQQPGFSNHMGINQMGFAPQNHLNNINTIPMFVNQANPGQPQGQPYALNFSNLPQNHNQNMGFPNLQNLMQNLSAVMPIPMPNPSVTNGPQNPNFFANPLFMVGQHGNANQPNFVEDKRTEQVQGNSSIMPQTQNSRSLGSFRRQGNPVNNGQNSTSGPNWKNFASKNFKKNPNKEASNLGYQKSQFHHMNNGKRKFGSSNEHRGKGYGNERASKYARTNSAEQATEKKRPLALTYTEQEIKQWREDRRKNYPSKAKIDKKSSERQANSEVSRKEAKQRREQLKEILAKQAELGVEVAEIPPYYLSDSEKQVNERENNHRFVGKKGRFQNKHDRRGRYNKNDRSAKQQKLMNNDSSQISSFNTKKPTLLQKLLSADVRRDKHRLLQAFRFMVMNYFFDDLPEKPLEFPLIAVKEDEREDLAVAETSSLAQKDILEVTSFGRAGGGDEDDDSHDYERVEQINRTEEEEGEIID
ncbi:uncharacterized protein LOC105631110 isoform X2 [Jatropha curcas]|nr:uncharacterized protein LOC105631110 isoform X2 [Jatropha curcas]